MQAIIGSIEREWQHENSRYLEIRPRREMGLQTSLSHSTYAYWCHQLDLSPDLNTLFGNCHKSSTQRKIQRAEREGLTYVEGQSDLLIDMFYELFVVTRQRHKVPPQPKVWFRNLRDCFGEAMKIRVASKGRDPVAAILTIRHKKTLVYKYGGSDARYNNLGGTHLLFWKAIQGAKAEGVDIFDFGRSNLDNTGLITFKDRWGCTRSALTYTRIGLTQRDASFSPDGDRKEKLAKYVISKLPDKAFRYIGEVMYRHLG